ncbi:MULTISPECIES: hypothetical protein [Oscillatoriales]|uniref:Uncharacterized protein n=1 Tax=Limnospira fusiformis PMC 851.14 TaxID=2219512 RepID=A0ABU9EG67_LIMFS|nr:MULTISPECIES: hypothetical protein [Oscillatoriales]MDT9187702.1 hypothetical protein [Limnospira sp. PMC 894.15]MDT9233560.1 hypothetical protein [Limnospira sp. PMC 917.15]MEB3883810.1 hypothetical protein [Lyngbya sp. CCY1209]
MLEIVLNWKPRPETLTRLMQVSLEQHKTLESLLEEAIEQYLQTHRPPVSQTDADPLIGLYEGASETGDRAEEILQAEVTENSGLSWKD